MPLITWCGIWDWAQFFVVLCYPVTLSNSSWDKPGKQNGLKFSPWNDMEGGVITFNSSPFQEQYGQDSVLTLVSSNLKTHKHTQTGKIHQMVLFYYSVIFNSVNLSFITLLEIQKNFFLHFPHQWILKHHSAKFGVLMHFIFITFNITGYHKCISNTWHRKGSQYTVVPLSCREYAPIPHWMAEIMCNNELHI
jgi:hypothetical protein